MSIIALQVWWLLKEPFLFIGIVYTVIIMIIMEKLTKCKDLENEIGKMWGTKTTRLLSQ